jgi:hypothetical protein
MTQYICKELTQQPEADARPAELVASVVEKLFLLRGRMEDYNLAAAEEYLGRCLGDADPNPPATRMLRLYRRVLDGEQVAADPGDPIQAELRLTGMVAERQGGRGTVLKVRNRIFATVFNLEWIAQKEAEFATSLVGGASSSRLEGAARSLAKTAGRAPRRG